MHHIFEKEAYSCTVMSIHVSYLIHLNLMLAGVHNLLVFAQNLRQKPLFVIRSAPSGNDDYEVDNGPNPNVIVGCTHGNWA